jgi:hypothetical protein
MITFFNFWTTYRLMNIDASGSYIRDIPEYLGYMGRIGQMATEVKIVFPMSDKTSTCRATS